MLKGKYNVNALLVKPIYITRETINIMREKSHSPVTRHSLIEAQGLALLKKEVLYKKVS